LYADIIAAVAVVRNSDHFLRRYLQIGNLSHQIRYFRRFQRSVQTVGAKQEHVSHMNLVFAGVDVDE